MASFVRDHFGFASFALQYDSQCFYYRESMSEEEQEQFWRRIQSTVEKDVIRTDRSHSYFKGEDNPNIEVLQ